MNIAPEPPPHIPAAAAGWYPDAAGHTRWWNGAAWGQLAPQRVSNSVATSSMVLGIVGCALALTLLLAAFAVPLVLAGIILGFIGLSRANRIGGVGRGKAWAGINLNGFPILIVVFGGVFRLIN